MCPHTLVTPYNCHHHASQQQQQQQQPRTWLTIATIIVPLSWNYWQSYLEMYVKRAIFTMDHRHSSFLSFDLIIFTWVERNEHVNKICRQVVLIGGGCLGLLAPPPKPNLAPPKIWQNCKEFVYEKRIRSPQKKISTNIRQRWHTYFLFRTTFIRNCGVNATDFCKICIN